MTRLKSITAGPSESQIQRSLLAWWAMAWCGFGLHDGRVLMAFPLQAARTPRNGARMKAEGARAGTPDLFMAVPRGISHGLFLEMKKRGGVLSDHQKQMKLVLEESGYAWAVAYDLEHAIDIITNYLSNVPPAHT